MMPKGHLMAKGHIVMVAIEDEGSPRVNPSGRGGMGIWAAARAMTAAATRRRKGSICRRLGGGGWGEV